MWPVFILNAYWLEFDTFIHSLNLQSYAAFSFVFFKTTGNVHLVFLLPRLHQKKIPLNAFLKIETVNFYSRDNYILRLLITWYKYRAVHSVHSGSSYCNLIINLTHVFFLFDKKKNKTICTAYKNEIQYYQFFRISKWFLSIIINHFSKHKKTAVKFYLIFFFTVILLTVLCVRLSTTESIF